MSRRILVVAAHPDDEVLGCGGTIARHVDEGDVVEILIAAEGVTSRYPKESHSGVRDELSLLQSSAIKACQILGASNLEFLKFPDNRLDSVCRLELIQAIEQKINSYTPECIYVHHVGDVNIDHRRLHEAVVTACRPTPTNPVKQLFSFEVASSTEWQPPGSGSPFTPNWFIDISSQLDRKCSALEVYSSEMRDWPHPRSIESIRHLASWRGSQIGICAAEAFYVLRSCR